MFSQKVNNTFQKLTYKFPADLKKMPSGPNKSSQIAHWDMREAKGPEFAVVYKPDIAQSRNPNDLTTPYQLYRTQLRDSSHLLVTRNIPTDFICPRLYVSETQCASIMPWINGITLADWITQHSKQVTKEQLQKIVGQLLLAYTDLHAQDLLHRNATLRR